MRPEALAALEPVVRRLRAESALKSFGAGSAAAAIALAIAHLTTVSSTTTLSAAAVAAGAVAAAIFVSSRAGRSCASAAAAVERVREECRNVVITAEELRRHPDRAQPWVRRRVTTEAERHLAAVAPSAAVPLRSAFLISAIGVAALIAVVANVPRRVADVADRLSEGAVRAVRGGDPVGTLTAIIDPPPHTRLRRRELKNPSAIEAVEGSRLHLRSAGEWRFRFGTDPLETGVVHGDSMATTTLRQSGYVAVEPFRGGDAVQRRLIPITVTPDRAPTVRVATPARDLLLPDSSSAINVEASASDDFALAALSLRYTRVSGSGEQFEFVEGELPIRVTRADERNWQAAGTFSLPALKLEPGDSLVYRVVARDGRSGDAGLATSDTYYIEIAGPGQVALEGFEMPPDRERYALSQQMIVLKIQRLQARERGMAREALAEQTGAIAAEQRAVRANFVFLMGGHVEDEEEEAAQEHEVQEGRLENTARREISRAVTHMTSAEQGLTAIDTPRALAQAKLAVDALQRAFGRNRYLLRTLPVQSRIDPSRRLSGKLDEASDWDRRLAAPMPDREAAAARDLLSHILTAAPVVLGSDPKAAVPQLSALAETALQVNPSDSAWLAVSTRLQALREAIGAGRQQSDLEPLLTDVVRTVVPLVRRRMPDLPAESAPPGRLRSAWTEVMRGR